ncbi:Rtr1/RPAP2 family-domain-containing protein [Xylariomycetidae sp. FL0641]|nr:Rtr1/RPAP2 family-domain-containing protein [Xylariomycetidae sp. FL0641]
MASQVTKPKGILKKTSAPPNGVPSKTQPDAREVAIQHARIIHARRDIEDQIADSIIELSRFPTSPDATYSPSNPAPEDAQAFKNLVRLYQPSDYDDLIEERNMNGLCGYALCPKARIRVAQAGDFKLVNYGRKDFSIVPKKELEKWCSQRCAKRAMYVKVQLSETAAWERAGITSIQIDLPDEEPPPEDPTTKLAKDLENMKVEAEKKAAQDARDLALERGEDTERKSSQRAVKVAIREKSTQVPVEAPSLGNNDDQHLVLDGHKTKFDPQADSFTSKKENV